jgi:hypothetical protein
MDIETAINNLMQLYPDLELRRGKTAQPGHPSYEAGRGLAFHLCHCGHADPNYGVWEFAAVGPRGGGYYVGVDRPSGIISVGRKGYHWRMGTPICQ